MSDRKSLLSLRIRHSSMAAELIEAAVGERARVKWTAGAARVAPDGRALGGVHGETYCSFELPEAEDHELSAAIVAAGSRFKERSAALGQLAGQGAQIELYATANEGKRGEMFDAAAIAALARLNAGLAIDWCK